MTFDPPLKVGTVTALLCREIVTDEQWNKCSVKRIIEGRAFLDKTGISAGDLQEHNDDTEKALLHYAYEHYDYWKETLPEAEALLKPGAFGENISSIGMTEDIVCIGDIFKIGEAKVQVSCGCETCRTMVDRFDSKQMSKRMQDKNMTGWFYRVLEPGYVQAGDDISLIQCTQPLYMISKVEQYLFGQLEADIYSLKDLSKMKEMSQAWRDIFTSRFKALKAKKSS